MRPVYRSAQKHPSSGSAQRKIGEKEDKRYTSIQAALKKSNSVQSLAVIQAQLDKTTLGKHRMEKPEGSGKTLPERLQVGVEHLASVPMDDVRVHYASSKPAQLQAHAYSQGNAIYVAPGQEKHLPEEAWHAAQKKQGRVRPTGTLQGTPINDDPRLEREAQTMGAKAVVQGSHLVASPETNRSVAVQTFAKSADAPVQRVAISQVLIDWPPHWVTLQVIKYGSDTFMEVMERVYTEFPGIVKEKPIERMLVKHASDKKRKPLGVTHKPQSEHLKKRLAEAKGEKIPEPTKEAEAIAEPSGPSLEDQIKAFRAFLTGQDDATFKRVGEFLHFLHNYRTDDNFSPVAAFLNKVEQKANFLSLMKAVLKDEGTKVVDQMFVVYQEEEILRDAADQASVAAYIESLRTSRDEASQVAAQKDSIKDLTIGRLIKGKKHKKERKEAREQAKTTEGYYNEELAIIADNRRRVEYLHHLRSRVQPATEDRAHPETATKERSKTSLMEKFGPNALKEIANFLNQEIATAGTYDVDHLKRLSETVSDEILLHDIREELNDGGFEKLEARYEAAKKSFDSLQNDIKELQPGRFTQFLSKLTSKPDPHVEEFMEKGTAFLELLREQRDRYERMIRLCDNPHYWPRLRSFDSLYHMKQ